MYGKLYICNHPVYDSCTLFEINELGLAVIQQRYDAETKSTWWSEVDPWLTDELYLHQEFKEYFDKRAGKCTDELYPTVTIRQIRHKYCKQYKKQLKQGQKNCNAYEK